MERVDSSSLYLPASLVPVYQRIGLAATLALVEAYGGTRLHIPLRAAPDHALATLIGLPALAALVDCAGGDRLEIPLCRDYLRHVRDEQICRLRTQGRTVAELARQFRTTERTIRRISGEQEAWRQADLFG